MSAAEAADAILRIAVDDDEPRDLETVARRIQARRWSELLDARASSVNRRWSMRCDSIVREIADLARIVGPTPWEEVSIDLIEDGTYDAILRAAGVDYEAPDVARVAEARRRIEARR